MAFSNMPERVVTDLPGGKLKEYQFMPSPKVRVFLFFLFLFGVGRVDCCCCSTRCEDYVL